MPTRSSQHPCTELLAGPNARRGGTADHEGNAMQLQALGDVVPKVQDLQCFEDFDAEALGMPIASAGIPISFQTCLAQGINEATILSLILHRKGHLFSPIFSRELRI